MSSRRIPKKTLAKVLAFGASSLVLTALLAVRIGNLRLFAETASYTAEFSNASGIFKGDAVKLAGVDVGRVEEARIEDGKALVTFNVDREVKLSDADTIAVRWRNVLGQRFLYILPGQGGAALEEGATIPDARTEEAGDLGAFLNRLGPILRAIDPEKANSFLDAMNTALSGNEAVVRGLLDNGASLATDLGSMDGEIQTLIETSDEIIGAYASEDDSIAGIIDELDTLGGKLGGMTDDINSLVENFAIVQQELDRLLVENRGNIDASLADLRSVAETLERNKANLEATLCTLPAGVAPYFITTSWGEWFNVRVVEVLIQDSSGTPIVDLADLPQQTDSDTSPAFSGCDGQTEFATGDRPYSGEGIGAPGGGGLPTASLPASLPADVPVDVPTEVPTGGGLGGGGIDDIVDGVLGGGGGEG
jgi:phospholipid/cholesterol/gamma-HCH transport system substrate-binding protein